MPIVNGLDVRSTLLDIIHELNPKDSNQNLQSGTILHEAVQRLGIERDNASQQVLLTEWNDLFRTGFMSWGFNVGNPNPPFCHVTIRGQQALSSLSRDPSNPLGYLAHLYSKTDINDISSSYLSEALECYVANAYKASAVMLGAASESIILDLRDEVTSSLQTGSQNLSRGIGDWRIKIILNSLKTFFDSEKKNFTSELKDGYEAYWSAFSHQIRTIRNEAGHPLSINPITPDAVHASFLIFPELACLVSDLKSWVKEKEW